MYKNFSNVNFTEIIFIKIHKKVSNKILCWNFMYLKNKTINFFSEYCRFLINSFLYNTSQLKNLERNINDRLSIPALSRGKEQNLKEN